MTATSPVPPAIITAGATNPPTSWPTHSHDCHELVWVRRGAMITRAHDRIFAVPEGRGIWIPADTAHSGDVTSGVTLYGTLFSPGHSPEGFTPPSDVTVVAMNPVLESLLTHLGQDTLSEGERRRAEAVVFDVLHPVTTPLDLPVPDDPRIAPVVRALLADPGDLSGLEAWARRLGTSERTITRAFRESTGLPFGQWRLTLRIQRALTMLSEGTPVQDVASDLGYAQTSTFIDTFRRMMGTTPGAYRPGHHIRDVR
ncbi:AraC family transcriptional regulator [Corynebacterium glyciniphilum]|uniref:AraC family transcriptional regulator n=1 Tax=Corynebacterium glyciniphilum TaxID=1404244 RepID=UPI003DA010FE